MYLNKLTVSREFRDKICNLLNLGNNLAYWRLTEYLLFSSWKYERDNSIVIPSHFCAEMEGKNPGKNYSALKFLESYQKDVSHISIGEYQKEGISGATENKCRTITNTGFSEEINKLAKELNRDNIAIDDRVWMSNGEKYHHTHTTKHRKTTQLYALQKLSSKNVVPAWKLLNYLNNLAPNQFTKIVSHIPEAYSYLDTLDIDEAKIRQQENMLLAISQQPQPFYEPAEHSARVFAMNESLLRLRKDVRKILCQDWITADLKSAQLGIVAKVWNCKEAREFLITGKSIWVELCQFMNLEFNDINKKVIKKALYSLIFGMGEAGLQEYFENNLDKAATKKFLSHTLINALWKARKVQLDSIIKNEGAFDAFGNWHQLEYIQHHAPREYTEPTNRSILAIVAQSYELLLLFPIIEAAIDCSTKKHGFTITSYLFDGITFKCDDKNDENKWIQKLKTLLAEQAKSLDIITELEIESV